MELLLMPIRPENKGRYPADWAVPLSCFLDKEEEASVDQIRASLGFDPASTPAFWEVLLARHLGGAETSPNHHADIDMGHFDVEVKLSNPFWMKTSHTGRRSRVFRWAALSGHGKTQKTSEVTILIGFDDDRMAHTWVLPRSAIAGTQVATVVVPSRSYGRSRSALDGYYSPAFELLNAVIGHLHYDRDHHQETRERVRHEELVAAGQTTLFGGGQC